MDNEVGFIVIKDVDVFLLLIYALGQLECFLPPRFMKIDSNHLININIITTKSWEAIYLIFFPSNMLLQISYLTGFF